MNKNTFTLKATLLLFLSLMLCPSLFAQNRLKMVKGGNRILQSIPASTLSKYPAPAKSSLNGVAAKSSGKTSDILITEDFSKFVGGTEDQPDTLNMLASYYGAPGPYIDASLTNQHTWAGSFVYPADGRCGLISPSPQVYAGIYTPLGDYSGEVKVTCKVKALPTELTGSSFYIIAAKGGYTKGEAAETDLSESMYDSRLYVDQGWAEVEVTFNNYSADNDGFIEFATNAAVEVDDIKITTTPTFIAAPKMNAETNFTKDGFTANWQKVRKSFNYYIDLYKMRYLSDKDTTYTENFEGSDPLSNPDWTFSVKGTNPISNEGVDGSKALILHNGDTIVSPFNNSKYRDMKWYMKVVAPSANVEEGFDGYIKLSLLSMNQWESYGSFDAMFFTDGEEMSLDKEMNKDFANKYNRVKLVVSGLPDDAYVIFDNLEAITAPKAVLDTIEGDFPGVYYAETNSKTTTYTFTGLDPVGEYYYTVKSHYVNLYSTPKLIYAFGVSAPDLEAATGIDERGTYTANWDASPKATRYLVSNYGVYKAEKDGPCAILEESFDKVTSDVTASTDPYNPESIGNYEESSLDDYTSQKGWTGVGNTLVQGGIGGGESSYMTCYVTTPPLYLANSNEFNVTVKAYGSVGESLEVEANGNRYYIPFEDSGDGTKGVIDDTYTIPESGKSVKVTFLTVNMGAFMLDNVRIAQDVKAGERAYILLDQAETTAPTTSYTFTNLSQYNYDNYAYSVKAYFDKDGNTAVSNMSDYMLVDLVKGTCTLGVNELNTNSVAKEVARYNINGELLTAPTKGINIVKMSDGRVIKMIVK
jgi:hypothetical protein